MELEHPVKKKSRNKPTIREVASVAGVGIATVSRVLNKSPLVIPETTEHVLSVMNQLGYSPNLPERRRGKAKSGLRSGHDAICILSTGEHSLQWMTNYAPIYAYAVHGAEAALNQRGINCVIRHLSKPSNAEGLRQLRVDGLLMMANAEWHQWPEELKKYPAVRMFGLPGGGWSDCVTYNSDTIGQLAADYLFDRGSRNAVVIGQSGGDVFERRILSFTRWMTRLGGAVVDLTNDEMVRVAPEMNVPAQDVVDASVDRLMNSGSLKPDGIFVLSDVITPAVYRAFERHGITPGTKMPIVSCNNEKPYLLPLHPRPAIIDIQAETIGQQAVERLLWRIENPLAPRMTLVLEPVLLPPED